jgi:NAD(P)-dependent dehydrogenase (short-subunit alcohol dehydrogenase family)
MTEKAHHVLICGGTSRAGLDAARLLAAQGHRCTVAGRAPPEPGPDAVLDRLLTFEQVDFADPRSVDDFCRRLRAAPNLDIKTCVFFQRSRSEDVLEAIRVGVVSSVSVVSAIEDSLARAKGAVIFIGSILGEKIGREQTLAYHVSKGAVLPAVQFLAVQLGRRGIRVNGIVLSTLMHSRNAKNYAPGTVLDRIATNVIPAGRPVAVADVVEAIKVLSGPGAAAITGQLIHVDGGLGVMSQVSSAITVLSP